MWQVTESFTLVVCMAASQKLGLIAGNGKFPFLVLDAARAQGFEVVVAAIREETSPEIESKGAASLHWLSLGELSKLIDMFKAEGVTRAVMAGQVKHKQIFSAIKPDWRLAKLLLSLGTRNTDSLLGAVAKVLADEGIMLENSTALLEPLLAKAGVLTKRAPSAQERKNIEYGRSVGRRLAEYDIGQTAVIAEAACVAVEAMEGTDATIERAGEIMKSLAPAEGGLDAPTLTSQKDATLGWGTHELQIPARATLLSRALTVVKIAKPGQDMRFDVPVIGVKTIETMARAGASCLAVDAGRCLLLDGEAIIRAADAAGIAVCAE
jgi:UDP-2,3-diacylglucosamine hydrolase